LAPWKLVDQHLDTPSSPNELHLTISADRGSDFTLLFEQAAMTLMREMPVLAPVPFMEVKEVLGDNPLQEPMYKALETLKNHAKEIARRWTSTLTNARLEGMNCLF